MTQVQFGEINEFLEGMIVDPDDSVLSQNQFLNDYLREGRDMYQAIVLERDYLRRYVQPLLFLEVRVQTPITAVYIVI